MTAKSLSYLADASKDLATQQSVISAALSDVAAFRAEFIDFSAWLSAWEGILAQLAAEVTAGAKEGMDDARFGFVRDAEAIADGAAKVLARAVVGSPLVDALLLSPMFRSHQRVWQAAKAARQSMSWVASGSPVTGRLPVLSLPDAADALVLDMRSDPMYRPMRRGEAATRLNGLSELLIWRG